MARAGRDERQRRVAEVLGLVGLTELADRRVAGLSGGEQQRIALARAIAVEPRLLMLDEPLGALDRRWRERLLGEIRSLLDRTGLPAVYVTHDHEEAFALADWVAVMRAGRVVQVGPPTDVWRHPVDVWTADFLGFGPAVHAFIDDRGLNTPWGVVPSDERIRARGEVQIVLRPDAVRADAAGAVRGTVVDRAFAGDRTELTVESGGARLRLRVLDRDAPGTGDAIRFSIDADGVLVYPAD
jgi:thiamine transport system ATP-binding protein